MPSAIKRQAPQDFDDIDSENIDPLNFSPSSKKSRSFDFDVTKSSQTPLFALTPAKPTQYVQRAQAIGQKRKAEEPASTPVSEPQSSKRVQPSSAPAPAGRSPTKSKKAGILSRRRMTASPFTRINPPTFSTAEPSTGLPFSIDAALAGTVPAYKSKSKSKSTHRKSWQFEIHEDTPEEEMANLMEHSTCTLDISDDESRAAAKEDKDNKENIPPIDGPAAMSLSTQITATRRDMMTDETRSPLGDLDAKEFYAEGCHASSVILVGVENAVDGIDEKTTAISRAPEPCSPERLRANAVTDAREEWKEVIAQVATQAAADIADSGLPQVDQPTNAEAAHIQIWESESAKAEDDVECQNSAINDSNGQSLTS